MLKVLFTSILLVLGVYTAQADELPKAAAADDYHVLVFSYQAKSGKIRPTETHTFATWVRSRNKEVLETVDISWCPREGEVRIIADKVPGKNKSLYQTLYDAKGKIIIYYTLRTDLSFFEAAKKQRDSLRLYKSFDHKTRPEAVNCIHACSDVAGYLETGTACGHQAAKLVTEHFLRTEKAWNTKDTWVFRAVLDHIGCDWIR
jgi:hypothetical protein